MIENKRFTFDIDQENGYDEEPYFCNGTDSFYVNNTEEMELFLKEVNKLADENNFLKKQLNIYRDASKRDAREIKELMEDNDELNDENKELEQKYDKVVKFIRRNHDVCMIHTILKGDDVE